MDTELLKKIVSLYKDLRSEMKQKHKRSVSFGDLFADRSDIAKSYGFGDGSSCYDNVLIIGDVKVGKNTWIGPNVVLDGSGGLQIGDYCSISAGVQIYTHHTVSWSTTLGESEIDRAPTSLGSGVYVGPQAVVAKGVRIGDRAVIGAMSFVNSDIPSDARAWGTPAKVVDGR